jgi:hypothetical protein
MGINFIFHLDSALKMKSLSITETPIKSGRNGKGKMKTALYLPLYGEDDEIMFTYPPSRAREHIDMTLTPDFSGTLLTDGYAAYARYAEQTAGVVNAQCWTHTRR